MALRATVLLLGHYKVVIGGAGHTIEVLIRHVAGKQLGGLQCLFGTCLAKIFGDADGAVLHAHIARESGQAAGSEGAAGVGLEALAQRVDGVVYQLGGEEAGEACAETVGSQLLAGKAQQPEREGLQLGVIEQQAMRLLDLPHSLVQGFIIWAIDEIYGVESEGGQEMKEIWGT